MELVFLGTGSAYPSPHRGASCIVLRTENQGCWMFDCGESSQVQLMKSSVKPGKLSKIFITHLHGDHLFGLPGLLCTLSQCYTTENKSSIDIYGPFGLCRYLRTCLSLSRSMLAFSYRVHEIMTDIKPVDIDGIDWNPCYSADDILHPNELQPQKIFCNDEGIWEICTAGELKVCAGLLKHRVVSFGFVVEESDIPGKLEVSKLQELGIPAGPLYGKLKKGESVTSPDGLVVHSKDVMGPSEKGRKLVILGDTRDSESILKVAMNPDILVHEATNENAHQEKCVQNGHSTPGMAAEFAVKIGAKKLILTHFSQRYKSSSDKLEQNEENVEKLIDEAKVIFGANVYAADDFKIFSIPMHRV